MYRVLKPFEFYEPNTINEAIQILLKNGVQAKLMAGGVDLILKMRLRKIAPASVISLQKIPGLNFINKDNKDGLRFGAMTTLRQVELSPVVQKYWPLLHEAIHQISSIQVKEMATVIGNLCVATPASDIAPVLYVLGANVKIMGSSQERVLPIENLFVEVGKTCLKPDEVVTEIFVPSVLAGTGCCFMKLVKTKDDIAKVNVATAVTVADGICVDARIALGSVAPTPIRASKAEEVLKGKRLNNEIIGNAAKAAAESVRPITDVRSTAEYRKEMVKVLVEDSLVKAMAKSKV
jgi:carbon-monoxide dehydrogenase medium subunit